MSNRAFRISFDHEVSKFVIEIQGFLGLSWKPAMVEKDIGESGHHGFTSKVTRKKVHYFDTYKQARDAVTEMGLDQIYDDFTKSAPWKNHIQEVVQHRQQFVGHQPLPQGM